MTMSSGFLPIDMNGCWLLFGLDAPVFKGKINDTKFIRQVARSRNTL